MGENTDDDRGHGGMQGPATWPFLEALLPPIAAAVPRAVDELRHAELEVRMKASKTVPSDPLCRHPHNSHRLLPATHALCHSPFQVVPRIQGMGPHLGL